MQMLSGTHPTSIWLFQGVTNRAEWAIVPCSAATPQKSGEINYAE